MNIQSLKKMVINDFDRENIKMLLTRFEVSKTPYILKINDNDLKIINNKLKALDEAFEELGLHPKFPYPFYIYIPNQELKHKNFEIVRDLKTIPSYFITSLKKVTPRESSLFKKCQILVNKISSLDLRSLDKLIVDQSVQAQKIFNLSLEENFYDGLFEDWKKAYDRKNK